MKHGLERQLELLAAIATTIEELARHAGVSKKRLGAARSARRLHKAEAVELFCPRCARDGAAP
jgi:predicted house-cleaning noncanonical NTP pyrophosphatase (MazG superfamily)